MSDTAVVDPVAGDQPPADLDLGYQISIEAFSGPLDLLLYLVRRAQVDIADIPVSLIADQFVETLRSWERLDLDVAGDFILMAATLLEIKSRMVAPPREADEESDEDDHLDLDPRAGLIQQLLAYRRFKDAVDLIDGLEAEAVQRARRQLKEAIPEAEDDLDALSLDNADPYALYTAFEVIHQRIAGMGPRTVVYDDVPMEARMAAVAQTLQAKGRCTLGDLLQGLTHRVHQAGMVIAVLECTRQRIVTVDQLEQFGPIDVRFRPEDQRAIATDLPPEEAPVEGRRRRRPPLVTFQVPTVEAEAEEGEVGDEAAIETDEQRFLRELEEGCALEAVLVRGQDLEASFQEYLVERAAAAEREAKEAAERAEREAREAEERAQAILRGDLVEEEPAPRPTRRTRKAKPAAAPPSAQADDGGPRFTWTDDAADDGEGFFDPDPDTETDPTETPA